MQKIFYSNILTLWDYIDAETYEIIDWSIDSRVEPEFEIRKADNPYLNYTGGWPLENGWQNRPGVYPWPPAPFNDSSVNSYKRYYNFNGYLEANVDSEISLAPYPKQKPLEGETGCAYLGACDPVFSFDFYLRQKNMYIVGKFLPNFFHQEIFYPETYNHGQKIPIKYSEVLLSQPFQAFSNAKPFNILDVKGKDINLDFFKSAFAFSSSTNGNTIICELAEKSENIYDLKQIGIATAGMQCLAPIPNNNREISVTNYFPIFISTPIVSRPINCNDINKFIYMPYQKADEEIQLNTLKFNPNTLSPLRTVVITFNGDIPSVYQTEDDDDTNNEEPYSIDTHKHFLEEEKKNFDLGETLGWELFDKKLKCAQYKKNDLQEAIKTDSLFNIYDINILTNGHVVDLSIDFTLDDEAVLDDGGITNIIEVDLSKVGVLTCGLPLPNEIHQDKTIAYSKTGKGLIALSVCQKDEDSPVLIFNQLDIYASGGYQIKKCSSDDIFNIAFKLILLPEQLDGYYCDQFFWNPIEETEEEGSEDLENPVITVEVLNSQTVKAVHYSGDEDDTWLNTDGTWGYQEENE